MAYELAFALTGESQGVESALQRTTAAEEELAESADRLTLSHLRWNEELERFIDQQGRFVSEVQVGNTLREELNALGIRTNQQIQEEIRQLEVLEQAYADQDQVVAQLRQRKEMLTQGTQAAAQGMGRGAQAAQQFGYILNDAQQFSFGFAEGVRAISNNLPQMLMPLIGGGPWAMGIITALNLGATALTLWTSRTREAGDAAEEAGVKIGSMADQVFRLVDAGQASEVGISQAIDLRDRYEEQAEEIERQIEIQERMRDLQGGFGQATAASLEEAQRLREEHGRLSSEELEELQNRYERVNGLLQTANEQIEEFRERMATELEQRGTLLPEGALEFESRDFIGEIEEVSVELVSWEDLVQQVDNRFLTASNRAGNLREEVKFLQSAEGQRLMEMERQNEALERQIDFVRRVSQMRAAGPQAVGVVGPTAEESLQQLVERRAQRGRIRQMAQDLQGIPGVAYDVADALGMMTRQIEVTANTIEGPMASAVSQLATQLPDLLSGAQSIAEVGAGVLGDFAQQVGQTMIGFGVAGLGIQNFVTNPAAAIAAGSALVTLGAVLKRTVNRQTRGFTRGQIDAGPFRDAPQSNTGQASSMISTPPASSHSSPTIMLNPKVTTTTKGRDLLTTVEVEADIRENGRPTGKTIAIA